VVVCSPWEGDEYERVVVEATPSGALTLSGFLAKWAYTTAVNPRHTLAYLLYLGYEGDPNQLFSISRPRRQERKGDLPARSIYRVRVQFSSPTFWSNLNFATYNFAT
jgi:Ras family protein T1